MSLHASAVEMLTDWQAPDPAQDTLRHAVLAFLAARPDGCLRGCVPGHVTGSALVLDHTGARALLTLHPRFGRWLQLGGHCEDTDADIVAAALREATEESGIDDLTIDPDACRVCTCTPSPARWACPPVTSTCSSSCVRRRDAEIACSDESLDLRWWPLDALPDDCRLRPDAARCGGS